MKAAQKRRLLSKDAKGFFVNNDNFEILRHRSVIQESTIEESEASYKETGVLWVVDEAETKKYLDSQKPKKTTKKATKTEE